MSEDGHPDSPLPCHKCGARAGFLFYRDGSVACAECGVVRARLDPVLLAGPSSASVLVHPPLYHGGERIIFEGLRPGDTLDIQWSGEIVTAVVDNITCTVLPRGLVVSAEKATLELHVATAGELAALADSPPEASPMARSTEVRGQ
jgi:hypothetical protein